MIKRMKTLAPLLLLLSGAACADTKASSNDAPSVELKQPSVLEFGPDGALIVGDSSVGAVFAYQLPDTETDYTAEAGYNISDLDSLIETSIEAAPGSVVYHDLAVHPVSRDAYVSVTYTAADQEQSAILTVTREGDVQTLDVSELATSAYALSETADEAVSFWRDIPAPSLTITDLDYNDGQLFVSGLSTGEFASTLRVVPFPFDGSSTASSIEMYHAAHAQTETRAPIRAMTIVDLDGAPTVVAAYTCTPLVTVPVSSLEDGSLVTGKTIAELGYGNTPLEVIDFSAADTEGNLNDYILVVNREMAADLITFEALSEAASSDGITSPVPYLGATSGVETATLPLSGVVQATDQDNQFILAIRRDLDTGDMEMVSFRKGAFFRLSDFISEYNFPDYVYAENQMADGVRMFQNMLKVDEGYPDQIR